MLVEVQRVQMLVEEYVCRPASFMVSMHAFRSRFCSNPYMYAGPTGKVQYGGSRCLEITGQAAEKK